MRAKSLLAAFLFVSSLNGQGIIPAQDNGSAVSNQTPERGPTEPEQFDPLMPPIPVSPHAAATKRCATPCNQNKDYETRCRRAGCRRGKNKRRTRYQHRGSRRSERFASGWMHA